MAYVRTEDYKKQQQTALALHKVVPSNPYYSWAVMSIVMQVLCVCVLVYMYVHVYVFVCVYVMYVLCVLIEGGSFVVRGTGGYTQA